MLEICKGTTDNDSLNIPQDYLSNRKKRTKLDSFYSSWEAIPSRATPSGVPPGSILGPLLFNIFMCNNFLILATTYFTGYADYNTPFVVKDNRCYKSFRGNWRKLCKLIFK